MIDNKGNSLDDSHKTIVGNHNISLGNNKRVKSRGNSFVGKYKTNVGIYDFTLGKYKRFKSKGNSFDSKYKTVDGNNKTSNSICKVITNI